MGTDYAGANPTMEKEPAVSFTEAVSHWLAFHSAGRKPRTQEFNREIADTVLQNWHEPNILTTGVTLEDVLFFSERVTHYCPSRWNAIVACVRFVTPHGQSLRRRKVRVRKFHPPNQMEFDSFLAECDAATQGSKAGLVVRFLCWTGMRIEEARGIRWRNVFQNRIDVPDFVSKSGEERSVPIFQGLESVLAELRKLRTSNDPNEFVLPREKPRKAINSACDRAGIPRMSYHCFRHYFTTRCVESGVDAPTIALWLGHQDKGELLLKTYFHARESHIKAMAEKVRIAA